MGETGRTTGALKKNINSISIIQNKNFVIEYKKSKCRIKIKITMKAFVLFFVNNLLHVSQDRQEYFPFKFCFKIR